MQTTFQGLTARRVISATLVVVAVALAFWLFYSIRTVIVLLLIALFLGTAIRPAVDWLNKRGIPRVGGVLIIFLLMVGVVVGVGFIIAPLLAEQSSNLALRIPIIYGEFRTQWLASPSRIVRLIGSQFPQVNILNAVTNPTNEVNPLDQVSSLLSILRQAGAGLFALTAVFLLTYYWTLESERTLRGLMLWIPSASRTSVRTLISEIEEKVGGFVRGQAILCLAIGLAALIAYTLIGLPYALVLALLAGIFEVVPVVGPALGALPAVIIALTVNPQLVAGVLISTIIIQALENYILVPRIMKKAVGVNPIVSLLSLITLSSLLGLIGALLAIPVAAIVQLLLDRFFFNRPLEIMETIPGRDYASKLQYEYQEFKQDVHKVLRGKTDDAENQTDELEDELERLATQMEGLLGRVNNLGERP